jgi:hypothetical protein
MQRLGVVECGQMSAGTEFPQAGYDALRAADLHAPHIPEAYPGVGASALTTCIWIIGGACRRHERSASGASR